MLGLLCFVLPLGNNCCGNTLVFVNTFLFIFSSFANSRLHDDSKQIFSSFMLSFSAVIMTYLQNPLPMTLPFSSWSIGISAFLEWISSSRGSFNFNYVTRGCMSNDFINFLLHCPGNYGIGLQINLLTKINVHQTQQIKWIKLHDRLSLIVN